MIVYTVITGGKDERVPMVAEPGVGFVCFSDVPFEDEVWEYRPVEVRGISDMRRVCRRYKALSHIYFPGQHTVWIDGRISFNVSVSSLVGPDLGVRKHHIRDCLYVEGKEVVNINFDSREVVEKQLKRYIVEDYPLSNGLSATGILVRSPWMEEFNNAWWAEISCGSKRDQLSFDYVVWKLGIKCEEIPGEAITVFRHRVKTTIDS